MKKIFEWLILLTLFAFLFWQKDTIISDTRFLLASPCDTPITYRLGEIDQGYGLSQEQFLQDVQEASQIWDSVVGKNLFTYELQGKMVVNLIYTERQSMADNLDKLEENLKGGKESLNSMVEEYKSLKADFEAKLNVFNQEVASWNQQQEIPKDAYERLISEQNTLKAEADKLNNLARQLNLSVEQYNAQVGQFNQSVKVFKEAVQAKPEAGLYNSAVPKIDIYVTTSRLELIHTLAHEMGHALGLSHVNDPKAIMYPLSSEELRPALEEVTQLREFCGQRNLDLLLAYLRQKLQK